MSKELEALQDLSKLVFIYGGVKQYQIIEKSLKALEIIKEKQVNVNCIISGWSLGKYNSYKTHISLTKDEYDLLKEVLL